MSRSRKTRIHIVLGPTAAGKSRAAADAAHLAGAEVVSMDSMQVYRGMDIGTAKPSAEERRLARHHLVDVREPQEGFSTAEWLELAEGKIREIASRGRPVIFAGGTPLYLKALLYGVFEGPSADWELRRRIRAEAAERGCEALHERLREIDPDSADRIHPNDLRRIERALEIHQKTGRAPSDLRSEWESDEPRYDARMAGLYLPREKLYQRINRRVDEMIESGWLEEVERLLSAGNLGREASQALGYSQLAGVVRGERPLEEAREEIKTRTRQFAKRQLSWFRSFEGVAWIDVSKTSGHLELAEKVLEALDLEPARETREG